MKVRCIELLSLHRFTGKFAVDVDLLVQAEHPWHHRFHDSRIALHGIQAQGTRTIQLWRNTSTTMSQQTSPHSWHLRKHVSKEHFKKRACNEMPVRCVVLPRPTKPYDTTSLAHINVCRMIMV